MKTIINICRTFVGALFIFSGFIKLNDPLGFSYKLEEYFSYDVLNIPFLEPYALPISVLVVVFEVVLGIFLLIGYKPKFTVWSLLGMIIFFTFLTFYSAYFDKVKDCGCFGDAIKLTPWESFTKDVILLVLILVLFFGVRHIKPVFNKLTTTTIALFGFIACFWFAYHVLMHLPAIDFRAYKIGSNIQENMSIPEGAKKPVMEWTWTFDIDGKEQEFVTDGSYPDVNGELVGYETKIIEEGYEPKILDFAIESNEGDFTEEFLNKDKLVWIVSYNLNSAENEGVSKLADMVKQAEAKGYEVIGLSASGDEVAKQFSQKNRLGINFYRSDEKVLKTIVRANPGIVVLNKGTVTQKVHWNDIEDLEF